jgi:hypothetical protein
MPLLLSWVRMRRIQGMESEVALLPAERRRRGAISKGMRSQEGMDRVAWEEEVNEVMLA